MCYPFDEIIIINGNVVFSNSGKRIKSSILQINTNINALTFFGFKSVFYYCTFTLLYYLHLSRLRTTETEC